MKYIKEFFRVNFMETGKLSWPLTIMHFLGCWQFGQIVGLCLVYIYTILI